MATTTRSGVKKKKAPPGFRWKTVTKMNAIGRPYTTHVLVPIEPAKVPPETIFTAEESIRGAEDRKDSMSDILPGGRRRLKEATIPLGYGQDEGEIDDGLSLLDTKVLLDQTQAKRRVPPPPQYRSQASGALPPPPTPDPRFQKWLPGQDMNMADPNQLPAEAAGRNRPRGSFSSLQMVPGAPPPNPYKDNVGPIYGEEMRNVTPGEVTSRNKHLLIADNPPGKYGGIQGYDNDGQPYYLSDIIDIGAAGKINIGKGMIDVGTRTWNRIRKLFKGKSKPSKKTEYDSPTSRRARDTQKDRKIPLVGETAKVVDDAAKDIPNSPRRIRRALSAITPGGKTVVAGELGILGAAASYPQWKDNAIVNDVIDSVVETTQIAKAKIIKEAASVADFIEQKGETVQERKSRLYEKSEHERGPTGDVGLLGGEYERLGITQPTPMGDKDRRQEFPTKVTPPGAQAAPPEDPLKKFWGKYADDPAKRKQKYLDSLSSIWRKAAIMDAIAAATGGESRAPQFMAMMSQRMDAIAKFDDEERLHNIFKSVYYNPETNQYSPPKDKTDAYERAIKLGASPAEAKKIFGYQPEPDQDLVEWYYKDPVTNEYVTEHVRGKDTMPEGDYNWSQGKTPVLTEAAKDLGGTVSERTWGQIDAVLDRDGALTGRFDDALRTYMKAMKVDQYTGYDAQAAKREAEERILDTMDSSRRRKFTYPETISAELAATEPMPEELKALLRKARAEGYLFVVDSNGVEHPVLTEVE